MADGTYQSKIYERQGGDVQVVAAGGQIIFEGQQAVTQLTSITTGVTVNALSGSITTVSQTIAAGAEAEFVVTNSMVAATDIPVLAIAAHPSAGDFDASVKAVAAGSFTIRLSNLHATNAGNNTLTINFLVMKATA